MKKLIVLVSLMALAMCVVGCKDDEKDQKPADVMSEIMNDLVQEEVVPADMEPAQDVPAGEMVEEEVVPEDINLEEFPTIVDVAEELPPVMDIVPVEEVMAEVSD
jgi:hypothetical protein